MKLAYFSAPLMVALCSFDARILFAEPADPQPVAGSQVDDKLDAEQSARLQQGIALATSGNPRAAISQFYDPVITFYETTYTDPHQHYLSARSTTEALLYLVEGANQHSATTVVSRNWVEAHFLKGYALVDLQDLDAAHAEYERALKLAPRNAQVRCELGNIYNLRKEFTKALETYHIAEIDSEYSPPEAKDLDRARAWRGQGYAYVELRQWDDAERMYRQSMALDKSDRHSQKEIEYIQKQRSAQGPDTPHN
jgi:tetratricopeptide (TPR) repeat protein